jgi:type I restriction enzyme S subunit
MKKYHSYKKSGLEWMESVPEHWSISRLKYLGDLYGGLTGKSGVDFNNEENPKNKPYIPYTNIFNNTYISKKHYDYVSIDEGENQNRVKKYDMFFLMSSETHKDLGKSCILIEDVDELYLNSFCKGFRIKDENIYPLFLNYQILGHLHREMISYEGKGFTRINLRQDKLNDLFIFYPSLEEQKKIVQFLDEKTELIDKLISTKEQKVELLKLQRTSLINEVITKGLDQKVKMKNSGLDWVGEIPEHWIKTKIKWELEFHNNKREPLEGVKREKMSGDYRYYGASGIIDYINDYIFDGEFILVGEDGANILSRSSPMAFVVEGKFWVNNHAHILKNKRGEINYYSHQIELNDFSIHSSGSAQPKLTKEALGDIILIVPPEEEQIQIIEYLKLRTNEIDDLLLMEQNKIDLLKEYRQSLISEVITGKIDVRTNLN